jgi:hypothetical protein
MQPVMHIGCILLLTTGASGDILESALSIGSSVNLVYVVGFVQEVGYDCSPNSRGPLLSLQPPSQARLVPLHLQIWEFWEWCWRSHANVASAVQQLSP